MHPLGMSNRNFKALKLFADDTPRHITRHFSGARQFDESDLGSDFLSRLLDRFPLRCPADLVISKNQNHAASRSNKPTGVY